MKARRVVETAEIEKWAAEAEPGEVLVYGSASDGWLRPCTPELALEKAGAWRLHEAGAVLLTQRREADGSLSYLATRSRR